MGIDLTKLQVRQTDDDLVNDVLNEVFSNADSAIQGLSEKNISPQTGSTPQATDNHYTGEMLYNGEKVKVSDQVDGDGNIWVTDAKGPIQVKAQDLKPLDSMLPPSGLSVARPEDEHRKDGFWNTYLGDLVERIGAGASDFSGSLYSLADKVSRYANPVSTIYRLAIDQYNKKHPENQYKSWLQQQAEGAYQYADVLRRRSDRYSGKNYSELWDEGKYGDMVGEVFLTASESLPQSVVAMTGGGAGLALTGASAGARKYDQLDAEPETKDLPEYQKLINAVATGTFEALSEKLGDVPIGKELARVYRKLGTNQAEKIVEDEVSAWMKRQFKRYGLLFAPVSEGIEEVASQVAENITDFCTGVSDEFRPFDGVKDSFIYGAAGGAQFTLAGVPGIAKRRYDRYKARKDYQQAEQGIKAVFPGEDINTFTRGVTYMSPAEQETMLGNMSRSGSVTPEQMKVVADFVNKANRYKAFKTKEAIEQERAEAKEQFVQGVLHEFDEQILQVTNEDGIIQQVSLTGHEGENDVYIVKGKVAVEKEGDHYMVNVANSSPELYYRDADGNMQIVGPSGISVKYIEDARVIRQQYEEKLREELELSDRQKTAETKEAAQMSGTELRIENGDRIVYQDEEGKEVNGIVADAFSNSEHVFLDDGTPVGRKRVVSSQPHTETDIEETPVPSKEETDLTVNKSRTETDTQGPRVFEIENGLSAIQNENGDFVLNVEYTKTELEEGNRLAERLNKDYEDSEIHFTLVRLHNTTDNPLEKPRWGIVGKKVQSNQVGEPDNKTKANQAYKENFPSFIEEVKEADKSKDVPFSANQAGSLIDDKLKQAYYKMKAAYPDCLLLFRKVNEEQGIVMFEDAEKLSKVLGIKPDINDQKEKYVIVGDSDLEPVISRVVRSGNKIAVVGEETESKPKTTRKNKLSGLRYQDQDKALGNYISVRDEILRGIATGRFKFIWNNKDMRRGISRELGLNGSEKERRRRIWMFSNQEGYSVDGLAHAMSEDSSSPAYGKDTEEIRNEIIDVMNGFDTPSDMMNAAEALRKNSWDDFVQGLSDEELEWMNELEILKSEFEHDTENEIPPELEEEFLQKGVTENDLDNLYNIDEFIKFVDKGIENEPTREQRKGSQPGADSEEMESATKQGEAQTIIAEEAEDSPNRRGIEKDQVSIESSGFDALTQEERQIVNQVAAEVENEIGHLSRQLSDKKKQLIQKKALLGRKLAQEGQLNLFESNKPLPDGDLFQVDVDLSEKNLTSIIQPLKEECDIIRQKIEDLELRKEKLITEALDAHRKQGKLFKDEIARDDILKVDADGQLKDMALDYLAGEDNTANRIAYLSIKNKIENDRNSTRNIERGGENRIPYESVNPKVVQPDLSGKGEGRRSDLSGNDENSGTGGRVLSDGGTRQTDSRANDNGTRNSGRPDEFSGGDGSESSGDVQGSASGQNDERVDPMQPGRSRRSSGNGEERSTPSPRQASDSRRNDKTSERAPYTESPRKASLDAELDAALSDFDNVLAKFKKAGKNDLSLSLAGLTNEQIEVIGEIVAAGAKVGYILLKKGVYAFREWADTLKKYIGGKLKEAGLPESDIDELIGSMWETKVRDENGNRREISEFAKDYEEKIQTLPAPGSFQEKIRIALEKQKAAETIPVVLNDANNIRETLPMLLPEQQDDVIKAERRLFGEENKKGILFTNGTGTGKTFTGLGVIKRFAKLVRDNILIVVPSSEKVKDWSNDGKNLFLRITPLRDTKDSGEGIVVTTYANFRENPALKKRVFDLIVYDECHRIMESKGGDYSTTTNTHFQISNKNEFYALQRLRECDKDYQRWKEIGGIIKALREEVNQTGFKNEKEPNVEKKINVKEKQDKIRFLEKEGEECEKRWKAKEPIMKEQAKKDVERTKVVFLSATPFKTIFNLRYADGYLFNFPEHDYVGYNVATGENLFYIENFGAQFRMRYGRLETKGKDINAQAVAMQEIQFQQKLTREGAMSGRAIESNMDYSRDFVKPYSDEFNTGLFNDALNAIFNYQEDKYSALRNIAHKVFFSYHFATRLMETLKTSMFIPRMDEHIRLGRKIVVFHRRKQANVGPPFALVLQKTRNHALAILSKKDITSEEKADGTSMLKQCEDFSKEFAKLLNYERTLDYRSAIDQIVGHFGEDRVRLFNGDISKADKSKAVKDFNDDNSGVDVIVVQEESGKEGISLHDRTGKHQRVLMSLSAPISSITALQIEGRIFRIGQESNAIFEYPTLGLDNEMILFSQSINRKLSTTENLALGDNARDLIRSFAEGIENWTDELPSEAQGIGGKEADKRRESIKSSYERAVLTYFTNQKTKGRRDQREGIDYYPTPEPLGEKLVEWTNLQPGEWLLEPSAGHGAIAMWVPATSGVVAIEPSLQLYARLGGKVTNGSSKILNTTFENHDLVNKYDVIAMNPPFGIDGSLAMAHIEKAFRHLRNGGRLVAIVPNGGSMNKKIDKFLYGEDNKGHLLNPEAQLRGEIILPGCAFEQAGTNIYCRVLVIDKVGEGVEFSGQPERVDLSYCKNVNEFFKVLEDVTMLPRPKLTEEALKKKNEGKKVTASDIIKKKHTKTGEDLFCIKLNKHVDRETFAEYKDIAGKHDGYYSKFIKVFVFKNEETANSFKEELNKLDAENEEKFLSRKVSYLGNEKESMVKGPPLFRQKEKWKERERNQRVLREITTLNEVLNADLHIVMGRADLPASVQTLLATDSRYPGLYRETTGEVYLIVDEITDEQDAQRTCLHEIVGHKGIRGLFGKHIEEFAERVLNSLPEDERAYWIRKYGGDRQLAAEEYVAGFAEEYREPSMWLKVKGLIRDLLHKLGIKLRLTDGDLQYLLWKGVNRLKKTDSLQETIDQIAKDEAMFREVEKENNVNIDEIAEVSINDEEKLKLHNDFVSRRFKFYEAYQDRMLSVKKLQELIESKIGHSLPSYMNAYLFENTLASRNTYEMEYFRHNELRRMTDAIGALEAEGLTRREIENYVMGKHALERNDYIRAKRLNDWYQPQLEKLNNLRGQNGEKWYALELKYLEAECEIKKNKLSRMDFAGLTAIQKELKQSGTNVNTLIHEIEKNHSSSANELWLGIKECTDFALEKWFQSGMINRKRLDAIKGMYKNYVPLRGFDETIAEDVYEYFTNERNDFNSPLRKANGRRSRADNPFTFIASMAESSIVGGNKNLLKLHFYRLAQKYPSDLLSVNRIWYKKEGTDEEGKPIYRAVLPQYDEDIEIYRKNIEDFEQEMRELSASEDAFQSRNRLKVGYRLLDSEPEEHTVRVRVNGEEYAVFVHGDPRPAQAIIGLNDEERVDNRVLNAVRWMNRQMAANFTTRNPAFIASNLVRDMVFSITMLNVKEGSHYRNRFLQNIPSASGAIYRYLSGKSESSNRMDSLFYEFLENGGETGYTALYNLERFKKMIDKAVAQTKENKAVKTGKLIMDYFAAGNRWAEDLARFSVYVTSRDLGRPVLECVSNAKEVSVNFNRRGSGALGNQIFKSLYIFFNAAVQSLANLHGVALKYPGKTAKTLAGYALAGVLVPVLLRALGGEEAEEEYLELPDYVRKNCFCLYLGKKKGFITLPLPIELRAFFGIGDSAYRYFRGNTDGMNASGEVIMGMLDVLPLNPAGGNIPFVPDALKPIAQAFYANKDFVGRPIAKVTPYNVYLPEYRRIYQGTSVFFRKSSEICNYFSGGDYASRGKLDQAGQVVSDLLGMKVNVMNPAAHEHLLEEYLGGMYKTIMQGIGTVNGLYQWGKTGDDEKFLFWNVPLLNRFYNRGDRFSKHRRINEAYYRALNELRETESRVREYRRAMENGEMNLDEAMNRYARIAEDGSLDRIEVIRHYVGEIGLIDEQLRTGKEIAEEERRELEEELYLLKENMLLELKKTEKQ